MFTGSLCQAETITCSPNPCQNYAECADTGTNTISCACRGTGYEGQYCQTAKAGDCRAANQQCPSTAQCIVNVVADTAQCRCESRYIGPSCDIDLVFLVAIPFAMIFVVGLYFFMNRRYPKARNIIVLTVALTIYDFVTDVLFVFSQRSENQALFISAMIFLAMPVIFNLVFLARLLTTAIQSDLGLQTWVKGNYATSAATVVLALTNIESFALLHSNLFYKESFNAPFSEKVLHQLMIGGLVGNILEDIPQLVIQSLAASTTLDTITLLSIVASVLTISSGLIKHAIIFLVNRFQGRGNSYRKQADDGDEGEWGLTTAYSNMDSDRGEKELGEVTRKATSSHPAKRWSTREVIGWLEQHNLPSVTALAGSKRWDGATLFTFYEGRREPLFDLAMKAAGIEDPLMFAGKLAELFES